MTQQTYGKTSKRARDLLEMIELDTVTFDMMDLPPVKEYELYIRSYGRSDTRQVRDVEKYYYTSLICIA
jgi:hypothetical protein